MKKQNTDKKSMRTLIIVAVCFFLGISLAIFYKNKASRDLDPKLPAVAELTLVSDRKSVSVGDEFTVTLTLDSKETEVAAADVVVNFDKNSLKVISVTGGNYFSYYPINTTQNDFVKISGVASFDGTNLILPKGRDTVGQIKFLAVKPDNKALIKFNKSKTIIATNGQDIYNRKQIAELYINVQ